MTEITVVKSLEKPSDYILSHEERDVLYKELSDQLNIPYDYLKEISKLEDETVFKEARDLKPDILLLLVRKILDFNNVIPIVKEIKNDIRTMEEFNEKYNMMPQKSFVGGEQKLKSLKNLARKIKQPVKLKQESSGLNFLSVQIIKPQKIISLKNLENYLNQPKNNINIYSYYATNNESVEICGFIIDQEIPINTFYIDTVPGSMNFAGRVKSGSYNENYLWNKIFSPYFMSTLDKLHKNINILSISPNKLLYTLFNSEQQIKQVSDLLFDYLLYSSKYNLNNYIIQYINLCNDFDPINEESDLFREIKKNIVNTSESNVVSTNNIVEIKETTITKMLRNIEYIYLKGKFSFIYSDSIWFDLTSIQSIIILEKLLFINNPINNDQKIQYEKDIDNILDVQKSKSVSLAQIKYQNKIYNKLILVEMKLRHIYINKFGYDKFKEIETKMPKYGTMRTTVIGTHGSIMDYISTKEKNIIELEYKNQEKFYEIYNKNKAPWVQLVNKMRKAVGKKERIYIYNELKKYLPKTIKNNEMIKSSEGFSILCPHVKEQIELEEKGLKDTEIRDAILKYAGDTPLYQAYYCNICGELMTYSEMEGISLTDGDRTSWYSLDEVLKEYIWKQTNFVVRNFIEFKELRTNKYVNTFITNITSKLYDFINLIEKTLMKSKTSSIEEIENKKKLYTVIYIYAILIKIVSDNYNVVTFSKISGGFTKLPLEKLLKYAINKITLTLNPIIIKLTDINEAFLESSIAKAYKNITLVLSKAKLESPPELDLISTLILDPIYKYIANMTILSSIIKNSIKPNETAKIKHICEQSYQLSTLYGKPMDKNLMTSISKDEYFYQNIIVPKFSEKILEAFSKLSVDNKAHFKKSKDVIMNEFYEGYLIESFNRFIDYVQSKIYLKPIWHVKINKDPNNENIYNIQAKLDDDFIKFDKSMETLRKGEKILIELKKYYSMRTFSHMPFGKNIQFLDQNIKASGVQLLSRKYGEEFNKEFNTKILPNIITGKNKFHKHKWNILVYVPYEKFRGNDINLYKENEIFCLYSSKITIDEKYYNYKLVDTICSICLYPLHTIEKFITNPQKIIDNKQLVTNFYNYYENRCPESSIKVSVHEFDKNEKCKNCGFLRSMYYDKDINYFNSYVKKFQNIFTEKKSKNQDALPINFNSMDMIKKIDYKIPDEIVKWKHNSNIINELVAKSYDFVYKGSQLQDAVIGSLKVRKPEYYNMLINIGLVEKSDYEHIINGTDTPYKKIESNKLLAEARIGKVDMYIKEIIFEYNIFMNYKNLSNLPLEIKVIIDNCDNKEMSNILKLPIINEIFYIIKNVDYFNTIKYIRQLYYGDDVTVSQFLIEYLFQLILNIMYYLEKNISKKISQEFIIYLINKIFLMEKFSSKLKESKSAAIEATQKIDINDDINMQDHNQSRIYDDLVSGEVDKYSTRSFDYGPVSLDAGGHNSDM